MFTYVDWVVDDLRASFEADFEDLFTSARRLAGRILGDQAAAEDVAAEALARAWLRWATINELEHRDAWVMRVATNLAIDVLRRRPRWSVRADPTDHADTIALRSSLVEALRALPRRQREVVVLRHLSDLPERRVAAELGISTGAVGAHLHRALATLRLHLADEREGPAVVFE